MKTIKQAVNSIRSSLDELEELEELKELPFSVKLTQNKNIVNNILWDIRDIKHNYQVELNCYLDEKEE